MEGAYYFTYLAVNETRKKNNNFPYYYFGQHCAKDLNDGYIGSNGLLNEHKNKGDIIRSYPLQFFDNIFQLGDAEYNLIKFNNAVKDERFYNKANQRFYNKPFEYGIADETRKKISVNTKKQMRNPSVIKKMKDGIFKHNKEYPWSEERRKKQSEKLKGHPGWTKGKPISIEHKQKLSKALKNRKFTTSHKTNLRESILKASTIMCPYCNKEFKPWNYARWHGEKCKHKLLNQ